MPSTTRSESGRINQVSGQQGEAQMDTASSAFVRIRHVRPRLCTDGRCAVDATSGSQHYRCYSSLVLARRCSQKTNPSRWTANPLPQQRTTHQTQPSPNLRRHNQTWRHRPWTTCRVPLTKTRNRYGSLDTTTQTGSFRTARWFNSNRSSATSNTKIAPPSGSMCRLASQ